MDVKWIWANYVGGLWNCMLDDGVERSGEGTRKKCSGETCK